jgi:molybdopterin/thiamine biosynthesis adenylyltransferase
MQEEFFENAHLTRQINLIPMSILEEPITIVGAGAVGSFTTLSLAKMGFTNITVFDFDKIDVENMNCQFYRFKDIGRYKVEALQDLVEDFTRVEINARNELYQTGTFKGIVVSAVDSMKVRKTIWDNHKEISFQTKLIVDPRMAAEYALIYAVKPMDIKDFDSYEKALYTDDNAVQEDCTSKATMYTATMLAGQVCKVIKDFLVKDTPYARTTMWDIKNNTYKSFAAKA